MYHGDLIDANSTVREVLDLHGYTKEKALQAMTIFLDTIRSKNHKNNSKYMVEIITGIGSHSPHGPVLRSAVGSSLIKRHMNHTLSQGKGGFIIDAFSGVDLHEDLSNRYDSKIVVVDRQESCDLHMDASHTPTFRSYVSLQHFSQPISSQVMDDDTLLEKIKDMSTRLADKEHLTLQTKEELELKRAMLKSLEWKRIHELDMNEDDIETARALELSKIENDNQEHEYNKMIEKVLLISRDHEHDQQTWSDREQEDLESAMKSSRNEYEALEAEEKEQLRLAMELPSTLNDL